MNASGSHGRFPRITDPVLDCRYPKNQTVNLGPLPITGRDAGSIGPMTAGVPRRTPVCAVTTDRTVAIIESSCIATTTIIPPSPPCSPYPPFTRRAGCRSPASPSLRRSPFVPAGSPALAFPRGDFLTGFRVPSVPAAGR